MKTALPLWLVLATSGCPDVGTDVNEIGTGPTVEFDPAKSQATGARFIPFPNDLARDPVTGKIALGPQACESDAAKATRENILNTLDGFGTYETAMQVTLTAPANRASVTGHVLMFEIAHDGVPIAPGARDPVPVVVAAVGTTPRFASGDCDPANPANQVDALTFVPAVPLDQRSTYFVVLTKGITDLDGAEFGPSVTWALVASKTAPVTLDLEGNVVSDRTPLDPRDPAQLEQLRGLALLWTLHAPGLAFTDAAGVNRADILVGFQFTTQTVTDPLDPTVEGSPASRLGMGGFLMPPTTVTGKFGPYAAICTGQGETNPTQCFLKLALGGCSPLTTGCGVNNYQAGSAACALYDCTAIGDVIGGAIGNVNFQQQIPNHLDPTKPLQGPWTDPVHPEGQDTVILETLVVLPAGTPPSRGWPTIVFAHGLGSAKESALAIAGRFASAGFATVAIDDVGHGSRAVRISNDIALGCNGMCFATAGPTGVECDTIAQCNAGQTCGSLTASPGLVPPSPTTAPQCYAPFLSPDFAITRDGIRQTVLDLQRVVKALKACGTAGCGEVKVDPERILYAGMSLGGIIGTVAAATIPDVQTATITAGAVGWMDVVENTDTLEIRCALVNELIDAGVLVGEKWTGGTTGLCTTQDWKTQPGYPPFAAVARWILDPADGANFTRMLAPKHVLVQEVMGDMVVPNVATDRLGALLGLTNELADPFDNQPSAAITSMPRTSKFVTYANDATDVYVHSSLLRPAPTTPAQLGINGTLRLQVDATTYLHLNNTNNE